MKIVGERLKLLSSIYCQDEVIVILTRVTLFNDNKIISFCIKYVRHYGKGQGRQEKSTWPPRPASACKKIFHTLSSRNYLMSPPGDSWSRPWQPRRCPHWRLRMTGVSVWIVTWLRPWSAPTVFSCLRWTCSSCDLLLSDDTWRWWSHLTWIKWFMIRTLKSLCWVPLIFIPWEHESVLSHINHRVPHHSLVLWCLTSLISLVRFIINISLCLVLTFISDLPSDLNKLWILKTMWRLYQNCWLLRRHVPLYSSCCWFWRWSLSLFSLFGSEHSSYFWSLITRLCLQTMYSSSLVQGFMNCFNLDSTVTNLPSLVLHL